MSANDWATKDFYQVLGVSKDAGADEIKKAYRKLAREHHPDSKPGDAKAEERFKSVAEAYSVLSSPDKRKEYDEQRSMFGGAGFRFPGGGFPGGGGTSGQGTGTAGFDFSDLLGGIFSGGGGTTGQRTRTTSRARRGADVETQARVTFEQSLEGVTIPLRMTSDAACGTCHGTGARSGTVPRVCPHCEGSGMTTSASGGLFSMTETCVQCRGRGLVVDDPCPVCMGSGRGTSSRTMQVRVPAGVRDGQKIKVRGKGASGEGGGPAGDLYVSVSVSGHPVFGRSGDNLTVTVPVSYTEAALGAEIKVPTLSGGSVTLKVPPGTPNGRTFRARGRGMPRKDGTRADLLVSVEVDVPSALSEKSRAALEALQEAEAGHDPRAELFRRAGQS
ncbi:MAG: molecular chaperone DnaJ [Actinomycetota bacterium]|nr:molecular chaperone DnaJ [Actinomycetota bacterium]